MAENRQINQLTTTTSFADTDTLVVKRTSQAEAEQITKTAFQATLDTATSGTQGVMSATDKSKLDNIEANATADQTGAEIKSLYEGNANTNAFSDTEKTKLAGIADGAQVNTVASVFTSGQTGANASPAAGDLDNLAINMMDKALTRAFLKDYGEPVNARGSISGAQTIDLTLGNVVTATISAATTFTFSNPPATGTLGSFTLFLTNPSTNVTWPGSVVWDSGSAPSLTTSGTDVLSFMTPDGGTTWYGFLGGLDFA